MSQNIETNLIIKGFDRTADAFKSLDRKLGQAKTRTEELNQRFENVRNVSRKMAIGGGLAFGALSLGIRSVTQEAMQAERVTETFEAMVKSIGTDVPSAMEKLRKSTRGLVNDTELMKAGNKFMAMGLAETEDEMAKLSEIAVKLGSAMGNDATSSMENFALMLANQSILRLDSFGISSGKVRERIEELMNETEGLTREQAFMTATMEQAEASMAKLGDTTLTNGEKMQAFQARMDNMRQKLGDALIPILIQVTEKITPIIDKVVAWIEKNPELSAKIVLVTTAIAGLVAVVGTLGMLLTPIIIAFGVLTSPITLVVLAVGALATAVYFLITRWQEFKDFISNLWNSLPNWVQTGVQLVIAPLMAWVEIIRLVMSNWDSLVAGLKSGINLMAGFLESYANMWVGAVNKIVDALNTIQVSIPEWVPKYGGRSFGVNLSRVSEISIPRLAEGGIATKSTLANIGEAGPEAIIPLDQLNRFGVGPSISVRIDTFVGTDEFAEQIGDRFVDVLKRNQIVQA